MNRFGLLTAAWLALSGSALAAAEPMLFRLFLTDGTSIVSYGEFTRVGDRVVVSIVVGGREEPRLHATTLPADAVDWVRTGLHATSARSQWYARTRGEEDFLRLSNEVASVLNNVVMTRDRGRALEIARQARATLAEWPKQHFGYRQQEVREILSMLDEAISALRGAEGNGEFELSLVADAPEVPLEPIATMPTTREQVDQAMRLSKLAGGSAERVALLQAVLQLLSDEGAAVIPPNEVSALRRIAETTIREEQAVDVRYAAMTRRLMTSATRAAEQARLADLQRLLDRIPEEDARLGHRRPEVVQALQLSMRSQLEAARYLKLRRDQWRIRRTLYTDYQRSVGLQFAQLVRSEAALESIRRLEGPPPEQLLQLRERLRVGAERLQRVQPPPDLRVTHDLLLGAWRFAESAVGGRYRAAQSADVASAWAASSSAAGALLLLTRAQEELRAFLEPPQLQ